MAGVTACTRVDFVPGPQSIRVLRAYIVNVQRGVTRDGNAVHSSGEALRPIAGLAADGAHVFGRALCHVEVRDLVAASLRNTFLITTLTLTRPNSIVRRRIVIRVVVAPHQ